MRQNYKTGSIRIMIMEKYRLEKDWENHNTRDAGIDFLNWHKDWKITLLHIEPHYANEIRRNIEEQLLFNLKVWRLVCGKIGIFFN